MQAVSSFYDGTALFLRKKKLGSLYSEPSFFAENRARRALKIPLLLTFSPTNC